MLVKWSVKLIYNVYFTMQRHMEKKTKAFWWCTARSNLLLYYNCIAMNLPEILHDCFLYMDLKPSGLVQTIVSVFGGSEYLVLLS